MFRFSFSAFVRTTYGVKAMSFFCLLLLISPLFTGCDGLKPDPQDATLASFPRWVQGIFQLPLGASQGFMAVQLNTPANELMSTSGSTAFMPFPGLSMLTQLMGYAQQPNSALDPYAYWLMLQATVTQKPEKGGMVERNPAPEVIKGKGVWVLSTKAVANTATTETLAKTLGFIANQPASATKNRFSLRHTTNLWHQPAHQIWMTPYPEADTHRLLFASSQEALQQATQQLKQVAGAKGRLSPEAKLKLVHGLETLYGSATVPASAGIADATVLMGMPSQSNRWKQFTAGKKMKGFQLPWHKADTTGLKNSWTLLTATRKAPTQPKREQCHVEFVTPLYVTAEERKSADFQWLDFIFATPNTQALTVKTPVAISLSHVNESIIAAIEADAFPQWKQPLSMIKPALSLMQLDFNRDVVGLFAGQTWVATPSEKEAMLILEKTPAKSTSMKKWMDHLSGKSWLSKILFDGKLQQNPILEAKPLAEGTGTYWEIHLPQQSKNLIVSKLPPMGLLEVDHAFVVAPVTQLRGKGALKTLNQLIQPKAVVPLGFEPFVSMQFDATQPNSAWLLKHLNNVVSISSSRYNHSASTQPPVVLEAGKMGLLAGYQPSRGSVRGQFDVDMTVQ